MEKNPILIVDDDEDDLELIKQAAGELHLDRSIHYFRSGEALRQFLKTSLAPFLIICDVNLPSENGFDVRKSIVDDPKFKYKSVPFIFWSTDASEKQIQFAYDLPAQGFFLKPSSFTELRETFKTILDYWHKSQHPKKVS